MAFCAKCGASLADDSAFCGSCGQRAAGSDSTAAVAQTSSTGTVATSAPGLATNIAAALAYVLGALTGILFLVLEPYKNDRFVRFHAFQSILFTVAWVCFGLYGASSPEF
jgi:uncharacterized membrane protein YvbJ